MGTPPTLTALSLGVACCKAGHLGLITWLLEQGTVAQGDAAATCLALKERNETVRLELQGAHRMEAVALEQVTKANRTLEMARVGAALTKGERKPDGTCERSPAHEAALVMVESAESGLLRADSELHHIREKEARMGEQLKSVGAAVALLEVYAAGHAVFRRAATAPAAEPAAAVAVASVTIVNTSCVTSTTVSTSKASPAARGVEGEIKFVTTSIRKNARAPRACVHRDSRTFPVNPPFFREF